MRSISEAVFSVAVLLVVGLGLWMFTGEPLAFSTPDDGQVGITVDPEAAARGELVAANAGCLACHTVDGAPSVGPTWKGVAGSSRPLESGETVDADENYLHTSIVDPPAQVVAGFSAVMPTTYADQLTDAEIDDLVEYLKSLA